ncbi:hypothetical protein BDZ89DRAFT_542995 [Hymenopellis radicata]|nr:hypothetical protein BDZ89DRAFT_542995 [Hymenopellis radicata]
MSSQNQWDSAQKVSEDGVDPSIVDSAFGFGRRQCPGRHFSDSALSFIVVASVLTTSDIRAVGDEKPQPGMTSAASESYPLPTHGRSSLGPCAGSTYLPTS